MELGIPMELWDEPSAEVAELKTQVSWINVMAQISESKIMKT